MQLRQHAFLLVFRQAGAQAVDGGGLFLGAELAVLADRQALQGELVVGFLVGEERHVRFVAEDPRAQGFHRGFPLAQGVEVGQARQVAFEQHQFLLVVDVLLHQRQRLAARRLLEFGGDVGAQAVQALLQGSSPTALRK